MRVNDAATTKAAHDEARRLLNSGDYPGAISFAESVEGNPNVVAHLMAWTFSEVGSDTDDLELLEKGAAMWAELAESDPRSELKYNRANTAEAIFEVAVRSEGHVAALETQREQLDLARRLFSEIGDDVKAGEATRIQALTNLGNSYDLLGRDLDSIQAYDRAIAIDPDFGMAQGNKGVALLGVANLSAGHTPAVLRQAVDALDRALGDRDRVASVGGAKALARFECERGRIAQKSNGAHTHEHLDVEVWKDPYLRWCKERNLFLHVSPKCLSEDTELLDPLFFSHLVGGTDESGSDRADVLVDAFDAIKQDYVAARYSAWLVSAPESSIREQTAAASTRTAFLDSLSYARWGVRTGMTMQAFTAATNLLDKVASFVHLYYGTGRVKDVYFSSLWHGRDRKKAKTMDGVLAAELTKDIFNRGLLALCDLSCDLDRPTRLNDLVDRRHTATHRFLVAHELGAASAPGGGRWLDRVDWEDLIDGLVWQLQLSRAALVYLARLVEIREASLDRELTSGDGILAPIPITQARTEHPEV
jgi:tetratricopeptide (TPR) repeat protein